MKYKKRYRLGIGIVLLLFAWSMQGQDTSLFKREWLVLGNDSMPYRVLLPNDYKPKKRYPVVFFLHGSGERGSDNAAQLVHGSRLFLADSNRTRFPAIVVFPQCPSDSYWSNVIINKDSLGNYVGLDFPAHAPPTSAMTMLMKLVRHVFRHYAVNTNSVYVGGLSMGGMGTFELVQRMPRTFAAAFPICGGQNPDRVSRKHKRVNWWVFHGAADPIVAESHSAAMVRALQNAGQQVRYTVYPGVGHNSWTPALAEPNLLAWLFSNHRTKQLNQ